MSTSDSGKVQKKKKIKQLVIFFKKHPLLHKKKNKYIGKSIDNQNILGNEQQKKEMWTF